MITMGNLSGFRRKLHSSCIGKKVYPSHKHAAHTIETLKRNNAARTDLGQLESYDCKICGKIHIGHARK